MPTDDCARCGHDRSNHDVQLFGTVCRGKEWQDDASKKCGCSGFVEPQRIAGHKGGTRFPGAPKQCNERGQEG